MKKNHFIILLVILAIILFVFSIRFLSGNEDSWICEKGEWVKHGNPSAEKPTIPCKK